MQGQKREDMTAEASKKRIRSRWFSKKNSFKKSSVSVRESNRIDETEEN